MPPPLPDKSRSIKQAALMAEHCLLYYDRAFFLVNKPPDMYCQMSYSTSAKYEKFNILCKGLQHKLTMRHPPPSVHRLDKNTTGALLLPTSQMWARKLSDQFARGFVHKTYLALVYGGREKFQETSGVIDMGISVNDGRVQLSPYGKDSKTEWEVLGSSPTVPLTLLRLRLLTGRKHQLRIHLAKYLGVPVVGDDLYARDVPREEVKAAEAIIAVRNKTFLHSSEITLRRWTKFGQPKKYFEVGFRVPVPIPFRTVCEEAQIPVDMNYLKQGSLFVDGKPWQETNYIFHELEQCWVSPKLVPWEERISPQSQVSYIFQFNDNSSC